MSTLLLEPLINNYFFIGLFSWKLVQNTLIKLFQVNNNRHGKDYMSGEDLVKRFEWKN